MTSRPQDPASADTAAAWLSRARALHAAQDWSGCAAAAREVLDRDTACTEAELLLAVACFGTGRLAEAASALARVLAVLPHDGALHLLHARALIGLERYAEARDAAESALVHLPDRAEAHYLRGAAAKRAGDVDTAEASLDRCLAIDPDHVPALNDVADVRIARGDTAGALRCLRRSHRLQPFNLDAMSALCFYAAFEEGVTADALFAINRAWSSRLEADAATAARPATVSRAGGDRRIRLAYIAYDLFDHVTSWFLEPVLARHDRSRFHVTCYAGNRRRDAVTDRLRSLVDRWCDVSALTVEETAARIAEDGIDVAVLASFFRGRDRRIFAYRCAPVQVGYHNRVASSGLSRMDYILTEAGSDPPGRVEHTYTETLVRLSDHNVYQPPSGAPPPGPPPCLTRGHVTFGSFNNHAKITDAVVATWSRLLHAVPGARLHIRSSIYFDNASTCDYFRRRFAAAGADLSRIDFGGFLPTRAEHLADIARCDIALDPFPCNGGTTSCETLWMGLPLVTLEGGTYMGRQGRSYLAKLDLEDLVATDGDSYVAIAAQLAHAPDRLRSLRRDLRPRVQAAMFDCDRHVTELEAAYSWMLETQRTGRKPRPFQVRNGVVTAAPGPR